MLPPEYELFNIFRESYGCIKDIGKKLGSGDNSTVRELKIDRNKTVVGKLIKSKTKEDLNFVDMKIKGENILYMYKMFTKNINNQKINLLIEEKAILRDMEKLSLFYHEHNLLKLIYGLFDQKASDNYLRFITRQIINGLDILYRNNLVYYNIQPSNLLISLNLTLGLSLAKSLNRYILNNQDIKEIDISGIKKNYYSPECYLNAKMSLQNAQKQDFFALGATLFFMKYGEELINFKREQDDEVDRQHLINYLERKYNLIKSEEFIDPDFADFICSLIQINPEDRPSFEQIYRNKWLNENKEQIDFCSHIFSDEDKLIEELQKLDFLDKKEKELKNKKIKKFTFKKIKRKGFE